MLRDSKDHLVCHSSPHGTRKTRDGATAAAERSNLDIKDSIDLRRLT